MKINIELNKESVRDFFNDVFEQDEDILEGAFPLKLNGEIYEHFFDVNVDLRDEKVVVSCNNVFARYEGNSMHYNDDDFEEIERQRINVELSEQEKMLFLVGGEAYYAGKYKVLEEQKEGVDVVIPRKYKGGIDEMLEKKNGNKQC